MRDAIETRQLTKRFPKHPGLGSLMPGFRDGQGTLAVDGVTLQVPHGTVFGLVGPNGAGKTTLVKMLSTLILPSSGSGRVNGYPLSEEDRIKGSIGLVTGNERSFYPRLSCRDNLRFFAGLHNISAADTERRIAELSQILGLEEILEKRFDLCSTGMKHRLSLARSLLNRPRLLFLDEPTRSLDPLAAAQFRQAIHALTHREGCTVFLVTHDLDEAVELCTRVGVMVNGRVRITETPERLREQFQDRQRCRLQLRGCPAGMADQLRALDPIIDVWEDASVAPLAALSLALRDRKRALPLVIRTVTEAGGDVAAVEFETVSWEEAVDGLPDSDRHAAAARLRDLPSAAEAADDEDERPAPARPGMGGSDQASLGRDAVGAGYKALLFLRRDVKTEFSYRFSFLLQLLGILFSSASFYFVAQLLGEAALPQLAAYDGDYFSFVLIGIAFLGYQGVALYTFSGVIRSAQTAGTLEAVLVTPTRLPTILVSSSLWSFAMASIRVLVYLLAGVVIFGVDLGQANVLAGLVVLALTVLTLSGIGIISASFIVVFKRGSPVNFVIGSLSSLLSGVYYPVGVLPEWLQALARLFPLTYSLEAMRRALLGGATLTDLAPEIGALMAFSLLLLPLSLLTFRHAVRQAKRDGSLAQF